MVKCKFVLLLFILIIAGCTVNMATKGGFGNNVSSSDLKNNGNYKINADITDIHFSLKLHRANQYLDNNTIRYLGDNLISVIKSNKGIFAENQSDADLEINIVVSNCQTQKYSDNYRTFIDYELIINGFNKRNLYSSVKSIAGKGSNEHLSNSKAFEQILYDIFGNNKIEAYLYELRKGEKNIYQHKIDFALKQLYKDFLTKAGNVIKVRIAVPAVKGDAERKFTNMLISALTNTVDKDTQILNRSDIDEVMVEKALSMSGLADTDLSDTQISTADYLLIGNYSNIGDSQSMLLQFLSTRSGNILVSRTINF